MYGVDSGPSGIRGGSRLPRMYDPSQIYAYNVEGALQGLRGASAAPSFGADDYPVWVGNLSAQPPPRYPVWFDENALYGMESGPGGIRGDPAFIGKSVSTELQRHRQAALNGKLYDPHGIPFKPMWQAVRGPWARF